MVSTKPIASSDQRLPCAVIAVQRGSDLSLFVTVSFLKVRVRERTRAIRSQSLLLSSWRHWN
jgi:hypothetical protein